MNLLAYSGAHWATFLTAALLLNLSPGPDIAYIIGQTARLGVRGGFRAMAGIWTGTLLHILLAAAGISALIVASEALFTGVQLAGAAFLIWIGIRSLLPAAPEDSAVEARSVAPARPFVGGVLVSALNPKVALFFLAFLPQFVVPEAGPVPLQFLLHGLLVIIVAAVVEPIIVVIVARGSEGIRHTKAAAIWLERAFGVVFLLLGLGMLISPFR